MSESVDEKMGNTPSLTNSSTHQPHSPRTHPLTNSSTHLLKTPIIQVKHLSKRYQIGMDRTYKTFCETAVDIIKSPLKRLKSFSRQEETFWALKDINFEVNPGEVVGIIGRNGAGKSTLLKILSRITHPTEGEVILRGRVASLLEVGTGFHPELTGRENIYFNGAILGMTKQEIVDKFDEIVKFSGVDDFLDTPLKRYSSGMQVRLAFAVAAHLEPEILLVDEVLAVGDAAFQKKCLGKMKDVATGGRTVLFVSHNMAAINSICKRAIILENSQIAYSGYTAEVIDNYLRGKEASKNERLEWIAPDKELPFSDVVKIKSYYIQDEEGNIVKNNLLNSKKYNVVLELELFKNDPRLIFELLYYSNNEEVIFATDVHDSGFIDFGALKRGKFKLAVPVPVELFWNRSYKIELICALHWTGWILPPNNSSKMEFNFFRDRDLNPYSGDYRIGALAPVLPWKVEYLEG